MKFLIPILVALLCSPSLLAEPGGRPLKVTAYDYHDYTNENIESKTFRRFQDGVYYDFEWSFDRSNPGEVIRTEIVTDDFGNITRYTTTTFVPTTESFHVVQQQRFDTSSMPPVLYETLDYSPPIVKLTNAMIPGIAWGEGGHIFSTLSGESFYTDKLEILAVEDVSVTAGDFSDCLKIHSVGQYGNEPYTRMDWFCPEMGLVKRIHNGRVLIDLASVTYGE
jgi:hypothetical protein